jgi:general L-amino acid transport system substrate-binding protein
VLVREQISREPLAPVVVEGDPQWEDIVRWTLMGMINAEWLGISSKNVEGMRQDCQTKGCDPAVSFLLGTTPGVGNGFGLEDSWVYNIIKSVGNYAETYEKNLAGHGFERGMNALTENGGLLYSMPLKPFY